MNIGSKIYLKDIEHIADDSHLKLRVLKIWNFIKNNQVLSIEMIIMDEEGTKYQSRVFSQNFSRFRDLLKEDVIGQIVSFRPLETTNPNPSRHYIKMTITNLQSVHLNITIFGSQAHQMSQYLKSNTTVTCVVIVMQFVKLNVWNGIGQAQSHFDVTKMFINSDIVEINDFKKELKADNNGGMFEKSITTLPSYSSSYIDDFKGNFPLKTVCEITEPLKEMKILLVGSIVNITQNLPWYYEACYKCGSRVNNVPKTNLSYTAPGKMEDSVVIKCKNAACNDSNFHTVIKYIIPINVQDHTGTIGLTLFDREAKRLLDISAFELKKIHEASVQSVSLNEVSLQSDDVVQNVEKDVISQTDESFTPSTVDKSSATSPMKISGDLKRNLHDIYDVDGGFDFSSTKSKRKSMGEGNPLLVPKVEKYPSVVRLPFHLPNQQQIVYGKDDDIDEVLDKPSVVASKFTSWMECNAINSEARDLTYVEFPTKFVWVLNGRFWKRRKAGKAIGRIHSVSPNLGEAYFLRILLNKVKGATSFDEIRKVNGETYSSFRDACYALGLLDDDKEYIDAIKEASHSGSGFYLRFLFATFMMCNSMSKPEIVWEDTWEYLADGVLYNQRQRFKSPDLSLSEDEVKNLTLFEIEQILLQNNSTLKNFKKMPYPDVESVSSSNNRLIVEELDYDIPVLKNEFDRGVFFVYGYGGTGKTFLWKTISAAIRSDGNIVLNVASSGIASLLLPGGRTAHSRFILPFELTEDSFCKINPHGELASLIRKTSLIIWDETLMIHKHAFEALDRTLKDVLRCGNSSISNIPFGGKVIVFGGDFRQILHVVPGGSRQNIVNTSLSSSYLWQHCKVYRLTKNMRLTVGRDQPDIEKIRDFANWLLDIGEGKRGGPNDGETIIDIPNDILINDPDDPIGSLIEFVYPSILEKYNSTNYLQERAILAPKNEVVQEINDRLLNKFPGDEVEYLSSDSLCQSEFVHDQFDANLYSPDVLNGLKVSGLLNHMLVLKIGVPVMLLRNIDQKNGLCNGTRLQVISLGKRVIEARIMSGTNIGNQTFIPRMYLTPSEKKIPFKFTKRQFPLAHKRLTSSKK
ncbi:unnamed protein product [Lactuca virosa]|uniref:ATP-dependent DNA helicase n=1 Tax=Lactuca virosa TaxID=75947 RepID=A0AAU9N3K8_9ASTR|nr:unnamed protein product [Lactuca virosa]